jgi:hypothetical protein
MPQLRDEQWTAVSVNAPYLAFLKAEWYRWEEKGFFTVANRPLVTHPNIHDETENKSRSELLWKVRGGLLERVPSDTEWFEVKFLRREHLSQLRVIGRCGWDDPTRKDSNEIFKVVARKPMPALADVATWQPPLLWAHDRDGPFTILEGNNRLTAYAGAKADIALDLPCFVGLSAQRCFWHLADAF